MAGTNKNPKKTQKQIDQEHSRLHHDMEALRMTIDATIHDIKGPLGVISLSAELLSSMVPIEGKAAEVVKRIASASAGAINMIEEFLSARRIQEGTLILRPAQHDLTELLEEVVSNIKPISTVRKITLEILLPDGSCSWCFDRMGIQRVLSNLLDNAVKFTPSGGKVFIKACCAGGELHLSVSDTGAGIEPSEVNHLFERYMRLDRHANVPGTGLGLFVAKSIVEAHGGRIGVTSNLGHGTTFDIVLPEKPPVNDRGELISVALM